MWDMAKHSIILFFQGRLFRDFPTVRRQILLGAMVTAFTLVLIAAGLTAAGLQSASVAIFVASAIAGFVGGTLQPYLFKDLKYA